MDKDGNVDAAWMNRVHEVVDYVISQGMYCILNVHHDTGADSYDNNNNLTGYHWIKADAANYTANKARYEKLWQQIAQEFRNYCNLLLFEGYNEMLDANSSWNFAQSDAAYTAINDYAQSFVNVVRATGGNNTQRNLIVSTYGACSRNGTWNAKLQDPLKNLQIPTGKSNHIIFEVHNYPSLVSNNSNRTISDIKAEIDVLVTNLKTHLVSKGAPVIIGEWGTNNVDAGEGKTVKEFNITFGGELVFKGNCSDVPKSLLALGNLYKLWNTNPTFNTVDTYTQQLNQYLPFTVTQNSTNITAQSKFVTTMKGITHEEYQPAVALTFKGETEPQVMQNNMSATDRENYNKMMGNLNTLIQGCDKLLGSIVEKARQLGSTIKL